MMRTDSKGRSASPHRITYKSDFHAIKCSFDSRIPLKSGAKAEAAHCSAVHPTRLPSSLSAPIMSQPSSNTVSRGRVSSTRGTKIRENIFLQMDSQQLRPDGPVQISGSTTMVSPQKQEIQVSPFAGTRRSIMSSSSVLSSVGSISTPEWSSQDKSRSEEIKDIDRAALAQKFSVTRNLFETKLMGVAGGNSIRKSKDIEQLVRGGYSQWDKDEEMSGNETHTEMDGLDKDKFINLPIINISLPMAWDSVAGLHKSPMTNDPGEESSTVPGHQTTVSHGNEVTQVEDHEADRVYLSQGLTGEEPLRAELVNVNNESSESDENDGEIEKKATTSYVSDLGESIQDLVDDVFEPNPQTPYVSSIGENLIEVFANTLFKMEATDTENGTRDEYQQVTERWEGGKAEQTRQVVKPAQMSTAGRDSKADEAQGKTKKEVMEAEDIDKELYSVRQEKGELEEQEGTKDHESIVNGELTETRLQEVECRDDDGLGEGKEDRVGRADSCTLENEALVNDQDSQSQLATTQDSMPLLKYEEIPGVPELDHQNGEDATTDGKRRVKFSTAPIKVRTRHTVICY